MSPSEIVANEAKKHNIDPRIFFASIKQHLDDGNSLLLKEQDTVFLVTRIGNDAVEVAMFTADGVTNLPSVVIAALKKIKTSGAKLIYGDKEDAMFLSVLQKLGAPIKPENSDGHAWSIQI
jgi:hypothetical protein